MGKVMLESGDTSSYKAHRKRSNTDWCTPSKHRCGNSQADVIVQMHLMEKANSGQTLMTIPLLWVIKVVLQCRSRHGLAGSPWTQTSRRQNQASLTNEILNQDYTMCRILPWQVFYLAANFYPKSGQNNMKSTAKLHSRYSKQEFVCCILKG